MSSSRKPVSLYLTCLTPALWTQFYHFYDARSTDHHPTPPPSGHGVWVVREPEPVVVNGITKPKAIIVNGITLPEGTPELVAGCCIFPCDGPFAVVDYVNTNPALSLRLRKEAMERICYGVRTYGALLGKKMICHPMHRGIVKMMEKHQYCHTRGYGEDGARLNVISMYADPWVAVGVVAGESERVRFDGDAALSTELTSADARMGSANAAE